MHVHDELLLQRLRALVGHLRRRRFRAAHRVERAVGVVHRDERRGHAGRALEERAAGDALLARELGAKLLHARLELALLLGLRTGHVLVARHALHGDRRRENRGFGGQYLFQLFWGKHEKILR
ncbi:hypothetical protein D3C83_06660 [compost metagenome]